MKESVYATEAKLEATHWWFVGRRRLFAVEIAQLGLPADARTLDIGTSTGTNLRLLREMGFTNVVGLDFSEDAARFCREKGLGDVRQGDVCNLPFPEGSFDLVLATDIVEHIDNDQRALDEIARVLKPGGWALLTVPAFQMLWGVMDEIGMHKRRYRKSGLLALIAKAGLVVRVHYYFNYLLFAPIWLSRLAIRRSGIRIENENNLNSPWINAIFQGVFTFDVLTARLLHPPFGVSALVVAEKRA